MPAKVYEKVIVFGPTGNVGSIAAQTAAKYGSQVYLAMRDTKKPIPGLGAADEKSAGSYHRVQADLTKPDTIKDALKKTDGAKAAFLYLAHGSQDGMKSVFQALKDGGIEFVVFLSSFTVPDKAKQMEKVAQEDYISYVHTQAELSLASLYSEKEYVALRPGYFATNVLQQKLGIIAGAVRVYRSDLTWDYITPDDMGNVAGNILAKGQRDGQNIVYLFGPDMLSQREAFLKVGKAIEKDLTVSDADETEAVEGYVANGMPEHFAKYMVSKAGERKQGEDFVSKKQYETGKANVEKYAARPGMRLDDWADKNRDSISSEIKDVATEMPESAPEPEEPEEEEEAAKEGGEGEGEEGEKKEGEESEDKKEKKDDKKE